MPLRLKMVIFTGKDSRRKIAKQKLLPEAKSYYYGDFLQGKGSKALRLSLLEIIQEQLRDLNRSNQLLKTMIVLNLPKRMRRGCLFSSMR
jgi:hypothetical protein